MNKKIIIASILVLAIDQLSKLVLGMVFYLNSTYKVINKFFYITNIHNPGAAWGLLNNQRWLLVGVSILSLIFIIFMMKEYKNSKLKLWGFSLLIGGLLGNLVDRIIFGYVRDFFDFYIFGYDFPIFNVADIGVVVGILILLILIIKGELINEDRSKGK